MWSAIVEQIDKPGRRARSSACRTMPRDVVSLAPLEHRGGGAAELKSGLDESRSRRARTIRCETIGVRRITGEDDVFDRADSRHGATNVQLTAACASVIGEGVRDWA